MRRVPPGARGAARDSHDDPRAGGAGFRIPPFTRGERRVNRQWPIWDTLELGALAGSVPCARLHARQVLWEWGLARFADRAELVLSELITNAVKASRALPGASPVRLWLASDSATVLVLVWDASPAPPARLEASVEAEGGRGLMLVEAVSERWGWYTRDGVGGKYVWAIIPALFPRGSS